MFGWHPVTPDSNASQTNIDEKSPTDTQNFSMGVRKQTSTKTKRRRQRKAKAREFAKEMKNLGLALDTLQIESHAQTKIKETQRHTFLSNVKSQRKSKITKYRGMLFNSEPLADTPSENAGEYLHRTVKKNNGV